jgi:hypothetical protein
LRICLWKSDACQKQANLAVAGARWQFREMGREMVHLTGKTEPHFAQAERNIKVFQQLFNLMIQLI